MPAPPATSTTTTPRCPPIATACHQADYTGTNNPPTSTAGFPTTCDTCHSTTNWLSATFDHNNTPFPLTGAHTTVPCAQCHVNNNYTTAADRLLLVPQGGLHRDQESGPRRGRIPDDLHALPQHHDLDDVDVQPCVGVPADRRARHDGLRFMPHQ